MTKAKRARVTDHEPLVHPYRCPPRQCTIAYSTGRGMVVCHLYGAYGIVKTRLSFADYQAIYYSKRR